MKWSLCVKMCVANANDTNDTTKRLCGQNKPHESPLAVEPVVTRLLGFLKCFSQCQKNEGCFLCKWCVIEYYGYIRPSSVGVRSLLKTVGVVGGCNRPQSLTPTLRKSVRALRRCRSVRWNSMRHGPAPSASSTASRVAECLSVYTRCQSKCS